MSYINSKRRINTLVMVLIAINLISITALWFSQREKNRPHRPPREAEAFLQEELALSAEQMEKIRTFREAHFREMQALSQAGEENRRNMFAEIKRIKPDSLLLVKYAAQIGSTRAAIEEQTVQHFLNIKSVLTEEQIPQFNQVLERLLPPPAGRGRPEGPPGGTGRPPHPPRR